MKKCLLSCLVVCILSTSCITALKLKHPERGLCRGEVYLCVVSPDGKEFACDGTSGATCELPDGGTPQTQAP